MNPEFFSQFGEDRFIVENLKLPQFGIFIEVGAYDGIASSNTLHFERKGWNGFIVEPLPDLAARCALNRLALVFQCAVGCEEGLRNFFIHETDKGQSGLQSPGQPIPIEVKRLDRLIAEAKFPEPDLVSIDTEGTELDAWRSIGVIRPAVVILEFLCWGQPPRDVELVKAMRGDGYREVHRTEANLIFVRS